MNKKILSILLLVFTTLLSGCWDVTEPQRMYYVHALGIDFKDGNYETYMQIIDFANIAKSEQPNNPQAQQAEIGHAKGKTIEDSLFDLYHSIDQKAFWGHITYIILSEEVMKSNKVNQVLDFLTRYRETRYQIWVYGTKEPLDDLLIVTPINNKALTLSKLGDPLNSFKQESFVAPINLRKLVIGLNEPSHEVYLPLVSIDKGWVSSKGQSESVEIKGITLLSKEGLKGFLTQENANGIKWMTNETIRSEITGQIGEHKQFVTVTLDHIKVLISPVVKNENVRFDIEIKMEANVLGITEEITTDEIRQLVKKQVEKEVRETFKESLALNTDIYRLSEQLYRKDVKTWKKLENNGKIDLTEDSIRKIKITVVKVNPGRESFIETITE
ncbi:MULTISPECIES: Ger(x)C family spore germination protein [unclassified Lysinibacillus]|uniref:Ger(x)C family spore germination protein n=1 Tax=unclassified Lysinibacillus TaxID=2636778 RepID=UPI0038111558